MEKKKVLFQTIQLGVIKFYFKFRFSLAYKNSYISNNSV